MALPLPSRVELKEQVRSPGACSKESKPVRQFPEDTEVSREHVRPREASWKRALGLISRTELG